MFLPYRLIAQRECVIPPKPGEECPHTVQVLSCAYDQIVILSLFSTFMVLSPPALARTSRTMVPGTGEREPSYDSSHEPGSPWKYGGLVGHGDFMETS